MRNMQNSIKRSLQLTLAIIKPHVTQVPYALQRVHNVIISNGFYIVRRKELVISRELASSFYAEHKDQFFYNRLVTFMCSGPSEVHILARQDAIKVWRELMGPTKVYRAQFTAPESIRGNFGLTDTRNATHGSDSPESAAREIRFFFPTFDIQKWYSEEEKVFIQGNVTLCNKDFIHYVK